MPSIHISLGTAKRLILAFWALWWLMAFLTDLVGALTQIGWVEVPGVPLDNYSDLVKSLKIYSVPGWIPALLFAGIILWSLLSTVSFTIAASLPREPRTRWLRWVNTAYVISLGEWFAFFLADQVVLNFSLEENHMVQGGFQLLTWMAIHLLPDD